MNCPCCRFGMAVVGIAALATTLALAQAPQNQNPNVKTPAAQKPKDAAPPADAGAPQLPPGWTEADMQACMEAATPGPMHARLMESVGVWNGKNKMWMAPNTPAVESESVCTVTPMLDGRFVRLEMAGDIPGMGPFNGFAICGYDNVSEKFQTTWIDNCGTGQMVGTGELSSDGKIFTWNYSYSCPITRKPTTMREVETWTGKDTKTMEMFGVDPKSGKEYKMMEIAMTRKPGSGASAAAPTH